MIEIKDAATLSPTKHNIWVSENMLIQNKEKPFSKKVNVNMTIFLEKSCLK